MPSPYSSSPLSSSGNPIASGVKPGCPDIRPLVIETVITHLELDGVLRPLGSFYASYQFRFLQPEQRILSGHKPDRQAFLRRLFGMIQARAPKRSVAALESQIHDIDEILFNLESCKVQIEGKLLSLS